MRRLRDVLRLKYDAGLPHRAIAQACTVGLGTVTTYLQRVAAAGLSWPLPDDLDDAAPESLHSRYVREQRVSFLHGQHAVLPFSHSGPPSCRQGADYRGSSRADRIFALIPKLAPGYG
jgi:hypothetical protein